MSFLWTVVKYALFIPGVIVIALVGLFFIIVVPGIIFALAVEHLPGGFVTGFVLMFLYFGFGFALVEKLNKASAELDKEQPSSGQ